MTAMKEHGLDKKLVLFSGDIFGPSNLSTHFRGEQMVEVHKRLKVSVSCLGNHDTDFGLLRMSELIKMTGTPWLMANLFLADGRTVGDLPPYHILTHNGVRVGIFGVCEEEWLTLMSPTNIKEELFYTDFVQTSKEISGILKAEKCDYIVALTHMRLPNDRILAEACQDEIDLILGGHDHGQVCETIGKVTLVKSGTDFEEFSDISVDLNTKEVTRIRVEITDKFKPDPDMEKFVDS